MPNLTPVSALFPKPRGEILDEVGGVKYRYRIFTYFFTARPSDSLMFNKALIGRLAEVGVRPS